MTDKDQDLATMPVLEMISALRKQALALPPAEIIKVLFINVMVNRIEQQMNLKNAYKEALEEVAYPLESDEICKSAQHPEDWDRAMKDFAKDALDRIEEMEK